MKVVIGLETHVQLNTSTKLFCGCKNPVLEKKEPRPNTLTCPICLGLPGSKPALNEAVIAKALSLGAALHCQIAQEVHFSRKSYFYPDLPKNYQITQYEIPLIGSGSVFLDKKKIHIRRIHIEEDPGRLIHEPSRTLVDYNRSGVPLLEMVTEPDFQSPKEARDYLQKLALILEYVGLYSPNSRAIIKSDANISLQRGSKLGVRVEVKNITGTKEIEAALSYEVMRQKTLLKRGQSVSRETRSWIPERGATMETREKEAEEEYGYIFEPDLTPVDVTEALKQSIRKALPELPDRKKKRFEKEFALTSALAAALVSDLEISHLFESLAKTLSPPLAASWVAGYLKKTLNYHNLRLSQTSISIKDIRYLLGLFEKQKITDKNAEQAIRRMVVEKLPAKEIVKEYHYQVRRFDLPILLRDVLKQYPKALEDYKKGSDKPINFFIGKAMEATGGRVDAKEIKRSLLELLEKDYV